MGCNHCRERCPDEEQLLRERQAALRLHLVKTKTLYETFTLVARGNSLNAKAFEDAVQRLNLCVSSTAFPGLLEQFYESLKGEAGIPLQSLQLLAVLLGTSLPLERADFLFQAYDSAYALQLSKATIEQLVRDITHFAVNILGQLATNTQPINMQRYFTDLKAAREEYCNKRIADIIGDREYVSKQEFIALFSTNSDCRSLLTANDLRLALFGLRKEQLVKRRAKVPPGLSLSLPTPRAE
jgi:hypothetical protein